MKINVLVTSQESFLIDDDAVKSAIYEVRNENAASSIAKALTDVGTYKDNDAMTEAWGYAHLPLLYERYQTLSLSDILDKMAYLGSLPPDLDALNPSQGEKIEGIPNGNFEMYGDIGFWCARLGREIDKTPTWKDALLLMMARTGTEEVAGYAIDFVEKLQDDSD